MFLAHLKVSIFIFVLFHTFNLYAAQSLTAKIEIPYPDSLVRGDVPVFGKAYGKDFKEFILDYGEGKTPKEWILINKSNTPQREYKSSVGQDMTSFGKTIEGNLGTWDTGLDEYEYGEHSVNLSGTYTIRLRSFDKKGNFAEDRKTVEIGRIVLNSIGGKAQSEDGLATLEVKEHSLYTSALLVSLKSLDKNPFPQEDLFLASKAYELREPDEKFAHPATLKIKYNTDLDPATSRVYSYDTQKKTWHPLDTKHIESENALLTEITHTPAKFALYAIFSSNEKIEAAPSKQQPFARKTKDEILFQHNTFEEGLEWHTKYPDIGARLSLAKKEDDTNCLKLTNPTLPSNFSSSIISEPFDVKDYPFIKFDYKIPKDLKMNFQVKAGNKWYDIVFTDDEKTYWDVNMEKIGKIENIITDDKWHTAYFNLYDMLKDKTNDFIIQEFTMADWDVIGFMKLELGKNRKGTTYYIDNFIIAPSSHSLAAKAKNVFDEKKDFKTAKEYAQTCIDIYSDIANAQQASLKDFPPKEDVPKYDVLNSVAVSHFVLADIFKVNGEIQEAKKGFKFIIDNYPFAKWWDTRGGYWEIADVSENIIIEFETEYRFGNTSSETLTNKAWYYLEKKDYQGVELFAKKCIYYYKDEALEQQSQLKDFAPTNFAFYYWALNNVGTCYFILGEAYLVQGKFEEAKKMYQEVINNFYFAQCWDPKGWFWKVAEVCKERISKIESKER